MPSQTTLFRNAGYVLTGELTSPVADATAVLVVDGRISALLSDSDARDRDADLVVDVCGATIAPGLIDSHVHPVVGDWTPRQSQMNWIDSSLHGGVTAMVSAGEVHTPGRPKDILGLKALAVVAQRTFDNLRPSGVKVYAGAPVIEKGMTEDDFVELAAAGVRWLGEVGLGSVKAGDEARKMVAWARAQGINTTIHTGGPSIPGSGLIDRDVVMDADPDVIGHINGGHTALPDDQIEDLCRSARGAIELVHNGNGRSALVALDAARGSERLDAVILGTDGPAGSGVQPLGILRMIAHLASLGSMNPAEAFCLATGNTGRARGLDHGTVAVGRPADLIVIDRPEGGAGRDALEAVALGDLPGVGLTMVDGVIRSRRSRNTPPAERLPVVTDRHGVLC
ncbi:MAG: Adenine deaminase [Acidimicrobiales bacterium]|nr:Adenine deaminase [Acidimicrobiales bacterium]